jgi:hypothetical protein
MGTDRIVLGLESRGRCLHRELVRLVDVLHRRLSGELRLLLGSL